MAFSPTSPSSSSFAPQMRTHHHPSTSNLVLRQKRATILPPGKFPHETQPHTHTEPFFRLSFGRNERQSEPDFEGNQNRPKFYIVNKICQTGQKHTFLFEFKLAFQKKTFRTKSTLFCLSIYAKLAKVTVPFRWYHLGKILSFQILPIHKKGTKN